MDSQDTKINYKIILAAMVAVVIGILIAFYYSHAQSETKISFLEEEKVILVKDLTLMKAEVDRLSTANEVNEIELQDSKYKIEQLLDSVGSLNFNIAKLREYKKEFRQMELLHDSLKLKNNSLRYNNSVLAQKYNETKAKIDNLEDESASLAEAEAILLQKNKRLNEELSIKSYLRMQEAEGVSYRVRSGSITQTNKASTVSRLKGCVTVVNDVNVIHEEKTIYFQFLDPNKKVIEHNSTSINVNGNIYSKKVMFDYNGEILPVCDNIQVPEGTLKAGIYTLNIFENQKLLQSTEFVLK
jgi:predicted RNase H-like nuclease (RuvC/YqgF family)